MNLPVDVEDPTLLDHTPLRNGIAVHKCTEGRRSSAKDAVSLFVKEMRQDRRATAAAKEWARLVFQSVLHGNSFEVTDGGEELYKVFFEYQRLLHQGKESNDLASARQYEARIIRSGISIIKGVEVKRGHAERLSTRKRGNEGKSKGKNNQRPSRRSFSKKPSRQVEIAIPQSGAGDRAVCTNLSRESHSTASGTVIQQGSAADAPRVAGARPSNLSEDTKLNIRSKSKRERKRKASSQKPPVIAPSDTSEDDNEPPGTHAVTAPNSISHRSKRIASNPPHQSHGPTVKNRLDKTNSIRKNDQHRKGTTSISQRQSSLNGFASGGFVSRSRVQGRLGVRLPLSDRKPNGRRFLTVPTRSFRPRPDVGRSRKIKLARDPQPPAKRIRRVSMSTFDREAGEGPKSAHNWRANILPQPVTKRSLVTSYSLSRENVQSKARKKRTLLEFERPSVVSDDDASANSHESLGPDTRSFRPLPKKIHGMRLVQAVRRAPSGAPSLDHADQILRDAASNGLAILREEVGQDIPDWTQEDKEHDVECDDLRGDDQDEADNTQDITTPFAPTKPPVPAPPRIWAQSRQEVCESFDYFRCYHSGVYFKDDIVKGYLLGAYSASRDKFHHDGKLIISHGGGKSESILDPRRGPRRYQMDQDQEASDKSVRALLKTCKDRRPIVLLADDKYALFPYDLTLGSYTYVVLGLYWISHAWAECQPSRDGAGRIVRWKFAFQWCEGQGDPWWLPQEMMGTTTSHPPNSTLILGTRFADRSSNPANTDRDPSTQCENCREYSPFIYKQGWMCLNPRCILFWSINDEEPKQPDYREEFLKLLPQKFERLPNIIPTKVIETPDGVTTTFPFSKGLHCRNCGRLSCRYKWEHWECSSCNSKHVVNGRVRSPKEFWHQRPSKGFLHSQIGKDSGILHCRPEPINLGVRRGFTNLLTFVLPHDRGKIHLILGTPLSNGDADDIFQLYQQQASTGELKLRRYPLRMHRARGLLLTNYFSQNSGEPYQYVGGSGQTVPFSEAPECVRRALALIKERASLALCTNIPFNEILSAAYMERQKMSFHSDSEKGLGPIVASLSLGSAALMHFRPLAHVNVENSIAKCSYALTLVLRHGDVLIMEGDGVQKYYEHTVVPMNFRIAATARCIGTA